LRAVLEEEFLTSPLFKILKSLDNAKVHYFIERHRADTVDITATFVGKRLEITVFEDDHVEASEFLGHEDFLDEDLLWNAVNEEVKDLTQR
jgi:hypothetical protein